MNWTMLSIVQYTDLHCTIYDKPLHNIISNDAVPTFIVNTTITSPIKPRHIPDPGALEVGCTSVLLYFRLHTLPSGCTPALDETNFKLGILQFDCTSNSMHALPRGCTSTLDVLRSIVVRIV